MTRRPPRRELVLRELRRAGRNGATTAQLCHPQVGGVRFSARIEELRKAGFVITQRYERPGSHRYVLVLVPTPEVGPGAGEPNEGQSSDTVPPGGVSGSGADLSLFEPTVGKSAPVNAAVRDWEAA